MTIDKDSTEAGKPTGQPTRPRSPGLQHLHDRYVGDDPARKASYERALAEYRAEMEPRHGTA